MASALGVAKIGSKPAVDTQILARAQLPDRLLYLGEDSVAVTRAFRAESLRLLVPQLGGFLGVPQYGLAAQVIGRRDTLMGSIQHNLTNGTLIQPNERAPRPTWINDAEEHQGPHQRTSIPADVDQRRRRASGPSQTNEHPGPTSEEHQAPPRRATTVLRPRSEHVK